MSYVLFLCCLPNLSIYISFLFSLEQTMYYIGILWRNRRPAWSNYCRDSSVWRVSRPRTAIFFKASASMSNRISPEVNYYPDIRMIFFFLFQVAAVAMRHRHLETHPRVLCHLWGSPSTDNIIRHRHTVSPGTLKWTECSVTQTTPGLFLYGSAFFSSLVIYSGGPFSLRVGRAGSF